MYFAAATGKGFGWGLVALRISGSGFVWEPTESRLAALKSARVAEYLDIRMDVNYLRISGTFSP